MKILINKWPSYRTINHILELRFVPLKVTKNLENCEINVNTPYKILIK